MTTLELTHFERQLIAFGTIVVVQGLNRYARLTVVHQQVIVAVPFVPFFLLVERILAGFAVTIGAVSTKDFFLLDYFRV